MQTEKERAEPAIPASVTAAGVRYEAVPWAKGRGLGQNGGYISAVDAATGKELWTLKVYEVIYNDEMEEDKQDVFIAKLVLSADGKTLRVENERGGVFEVDLQTKAVTRADK